MATVTQPSTITTPTPTLTGSLPSSSQMTDMIMGNLLISKLGNMMQTEFTLTPTNIIKLLLLLSMGEIKNGINSLLTMFVEYIRKIPELFFGFVMYLGNMTKPKEISQNIQHTYHPDKNEYLEIDVDQNFLISLCNYIIKNKNCVFKESLCNATIKNTKENVVNNRMSNVILKMDGYNLELCEALTYGCDVYSDDIITVEYNKKKVASGMNSLLDILNDEQREVVEDLHDKINKIIKPTGNTLLNYIGAKYRDNFFSENTIVKVLCEKNPTWNKDNTLIEMLIIWAIPYSKIGLADRLTKIRDGLAIDGLLLFDINNTYTEMEKYKGMALESNINNFIHRCLSKINDMSIIYGKWDSSFADIINSPITKPIKTITTISIKFKITNKTTSSHSPKQIATNFIKLIYSSYTKNTTKTKIHYIKLIDDIIKSEIPNPEYERYETKKKYLESSKIAENPSNLAFFEFMNENIPSKTIIKETINKKIECSKLNEVEKDFDTLYLRKDDKHKLFNSLNMFKNKGHVLQKLGLPNKFNLFLYGMPGTGKSTTISVVANYLQKDIYYVDLNGVETNEHLQMIFEYVNKNVTIPGIIVMEDIDAMTNVVLKRSENLSEYKVSDLINNQKSGLTLEYLLNILQGTLTMDNSVYIVTSNYIDHLDPAFYRDGRFDVKIELKCCDKFQIQTIYEKMIGKELPQNILDLIPENKFSPASIIFHIKNYIFDNTTDPMIIMDPFITKNDIL
jgi:hypothetical protein